jgi:putative solute:sodium symporter small subunit
LAGRAALDGGVAAGLAAGQLRRALLRPPAGLPLRRRPFSFWWGAQGAMLVDLALVVLYAWATHRMDLAHGLDEED